MKEFHGEEYSKKLKTFSDSTIQLIMQTCVNDSKILSERTKIIMESNNEEEVVKKLEILKEKCEIFEKQQNKQRLESIKKMEINYKKYGDLLKMCMERKYSVSTMEQLGLIAKASEDGDAAIDTMIEICKNTSSENALLKQTQVLILNIKD